MNKRKILLSGLLVLSIGAPLPATADLNNSLFRIEMHLAEKGDAEAQLQVGERFERGDGVTINYDRAFEWYQKAAAQKHATAHYRLGRLYQRGLGVAADKAKAREWFEKAKALGSKAAARAITEMDAPATTAAAAPVATPVTPPKPKKEKAQEKPKPQAKPKPKPKPKAESKPAKPVVAAAASAAAGAAVAVKPTLPSAAELSSRAPKPAAPPPAPPQPAQKPAIANLDKVLLEHKWVRNGSPAEQLPSASASCLKAAEEVICFSKEHQRSVGNRLLTYTAKSIISGFTPENSFTVSYIYNVLEVDDGGAGPAVDPLGLRAEEGWQKPNLSLTCKALSTSQLECTIDHNQQKVSFTR